jgi:hypothetical protein
MTDEELRTAAIIASRKMLNSKLMKLESEYKQKEAEIIKEKSQLQESCPHKNMGGGQYTRWCLDCGKDWDTT